MRIYAPCGSAGRSRPILADPCASCAVRAGSSTQLMALHGSSWSLNDIEWVMECHGDAAWNEEQWGACARCGFIYCSFKLFHHIIILITYIALQYYSTRTNWPWSKRYPICPQVFLCHLNVSTRDCMRCIEVLDVWIPRSNPSQDVHHHRRRHHHHHCQTTDLWRGWHAAPGLARWRCPKSYQGPSWTSLDPFCRRKPTLARHARLPSLPSAMVDFATYCRIKGGKRMKKA